MRHADHSNPDMAAIKAIEYSDRNAGPATPGRPNAGGGFGYAGCGACRRPNQRRYNDGDVVSHELLLLTQVPFDGALYRANQPVANERALSCPMFAEFSRRIT
jgi:hypothetical protein